MAKNKQPQELTCVEAPTNSEKLELQAFQMILNREPDPSHLVSTPDGRAKSMGISFVETTLDELFFGQWSTENFRHTTQANEICGTIDLVVIHPITGLQIRRTGAASIQIMVDKGTDPLDIRNKKPNALDLGFPKLKAECIKNAAQSLGKIFGRDINRKQADRYEGHIKEANEQIVNAAIKAIEQGRSYTEVMNRLNQSYSLTQPQLDKIQAATFSPVKQIQA